MPSTAFRFIDAAAALDDIMDGRTPDLVRFEKALSTPAWMTCGRPLRRLRLLRRDGRPAVRGRQSRGRPQARAGRRAPEEEQPVSILCAYALERFDNDADGLAAPCRVSSPHRRSCRPAVCARRPTNDSGRAARGAAAPLPRTRCPRTRPNGVRSRPRRSPCRSV
jgi:hypothetical protein